MPKLRKVKRRQKFRANVNRKRLRNKLDKLPTIGCKQIKDAWEVKKSLKGNLKEMGLAYDPNEVINIRDPKDADLNINNGVVATTKFSGDLVEEKRPSKIHVAEELEKEARAPRERTFRLPKGQVQFVTSMMDKYGDDFKAMSRDKKNYFQLTWRQIRAKINTFKNIPEQYAEYLVAKGEIVLDDPTPLEETKKQQALDNYQKHCVSKKPKKVLKIAVGWEEESIEPTGKTTDTEQAKDENNSPSSLFQHDENRIEKAKKSSNKHEENKTVDEASNGVLRSKKNEKASEKRKADDLKKNSKKAKRLEKSASSDSEEELDGEEADPSFIDLDDMSEEELSDDDVLDDGEFVTDSEDASD